MKVWTILRATQAPRLLLVLVVSLLALTIALPASATGKRSATTILTDNSGCSFTVSYTWSGFSGAGLVAEVALGVRAAGGANIVFATQQFPGQAGSGGSVTATFTLTGPATPSRRFFARGLLFKLAKPTDPWTLESVRDSVVYSSDSAAQVCGSSVSVAIP